MKSTLWPFLLGTVVYGANISISWMVATKKSSWMIGAVAATMVAANSFGFSLVINGQMPQDPAAFVSLSLGAGIGAGAGFHLMRRGK